MNWWAGPFSAEAGTDSRNVADWNVWPPWVHFNVLLKPGTDCERRQESWQPVKKLHLAPDPFLSMPPVP